MSRQRQRARLTRGGAAAVLCIVLAGETQFMRTANEKSTLDFQLKWPSSPDIDAAARTAARGAIMSAAIPRVSPNAFFLNHFSGGVHAALFGQQLLGLHRALADNGAVAVLEGMLVVMPARLLAECSLGFTEISSSAIMALYGSNSAQACWKGIIWLSVLPLKSSSSTS